MSESIHGKLDRVRKPRVQIVYDVETEGGMVKKELPFVVGVMGDFSGNPTEPLKSMRDRSFVQIDRDNFDQVMDRMKPGLTLKVKNSLQDDGSEMGVKLKFSKMEDFTPANVVKQVEPLQKLMDVRNKLRDLQTKSDTNDNLEKALEDALKATKETK